MYLLPVLCPFSGPPPNSNATDDVDNQGNNEDKDSKKARVETSSSSPTTSEDTKPKQSFSEMMFASMSTLKTKTDTTNTQLADESAKVQAVEEDKAMKLEEKERKKRKVYVPEEMDVTVSTMRSMHQ